MIELNMFLIAVCCVIIIDISGFVDTVKHWIWKWVWKEKRPYQDFPFKPFECSFCMTWWICLIYLLFAGITFPLVALALIYAFITPTIKDLLYFIRDFITKLIETLYTYFNL